MPGLDIAPDQRSIASTTAKSDGRARCARRPAAFARPDAPLPSAAAMSFPHPFCPCISACAPHPQPQLTRGPRTIALTVFTICRSANEDEDTGPDTDDSSPSQEVSTDDPSDAVPVVTAARAAKASSPGDGSAADLAGVHGAAAAVTGAPPPIPDASASEGRHPSTMSLSLMHACSSCRAAKTACTDHRPCTRCVRMGVECTSDGGPRKRACRACHAAKVACGTLFTEPCQRCARLGLECVPRGPPLSVGARRKRQRASNITHHAIMLDGVAQVPHAGQIADGSGAPATYTTIGPDGSQTILHGAKGGSVQMQMMPLSGGTFAFMPVLASSAAHPPASAPQAFTVQTNIGTAPYLVAPTQQFVTAADGTIIVVDGGGGSGSVHAAAPFPTSPGAAAAACTLAAGCGGAASATFAQPACEPFGRATPSATQHVTGGAAAAPVSPPAPTNMLSVASSLLDLCGASAPGDEGDPGAIVPAAASGGGGAAAAGCAGHGEPSPPLQPMPAASWPAVTAGSVILPQTAVGGAPVVAAQQVGHAPPHGAQYYTGHPQAAGAVQAVGYSTATMALQHVTHCAPPTHFAQAAPHPHRQPPPAYCCESSSAAAADSLSAMTATRADVPLSTPLPTVPSATMIHICDSLNPSRGSSQPSASAAMAAPPRGGAGE